MAIFVHTLNFMQVGTLSWTCSPDEVFTRTGSLNAFECWTWILCNLGTVYGSVNWIKRWPWKNGYPISHRIHVWYIWFAIYHQYSPNVSIYTIRLDPMGIGIVFLAALKSQVQQIWSTGRMSFPTGIVDQEHVHGHMVMTIHDHFIVVVFFYTTRHGFLIHKLNQRIKQVWSWNLSHQTQSNSYMISPRPLSHEQFRKPDSVDDDRVVLLPIYINM